MGFQIIFNILKIKKSCKLIGQIYFRVQLENINVNQKRVLPGQISFVLHIDEAIHKSLPLSQSE